MHAFLQNMLFSFACFGTLYKYSIFSSAICFLVAKLFFRESSMLLCVAVINLGFFGNV